MLSTGMLMLSPVLSIPSSAVRHPAQTQITRNALQTRANLIAFGAIAFVAIAFGVIEVPHNKRVPSYPSISPMVTTTPPAAVLAPAPAGAPDSAAVQALAPAGAPDSAVMDMQRTGKVVEGLPTGYFVVTCKNASMYGKRMRDVHIAGFSVQSDAVVRFRSSDGKVAVADLLVGVGKYASVSKHRKRF